MTPYERIAQLTLKLTEMTRLRDNVLARIEEMRILAVDFARGHACDGEDFDAFVASLDGGPEK
jgi:hypothetical protein